MKWRWKWTLVMLMTSVLGQETEETGVFQAMMSGLSELPVIGNVLRAKVHPIYRPLVSHFQPRVTKGEEDLSELCFGEIGCYEVDDDFFHPIHRPLNLPPNSREEIQVKFTVHTREDEMGMPVEGIYLDPILNSTFKPNLKTKIIIHGFLHGNWVTWMWDMVRTFLLQGDYNVISVDWSSGSGPPYSQAVANTRVVGLEVAHLVNWLKKHTGLDPKDVHILGHSLGSHISGYAGERIHNLGRITGLDPAEPYFQYMPTKVRLDPSDANFVDVIHTDSESILTLGYGMSQPVGHIDFYPNNGHNQPGCDSLIRVPMVVLTDGINIFEGLDAGRNELISCSHSRAPKLFTDSILSECPYRAYRCVSYQDYIKGKCQTCEKDGSRCAQMGFHADKWPRTTNESSMNFYLSTSSGPKRFCLYHYLLTVDIAAPNEKDGSLRGNLKISIINEDGNIYDFNVTPEDPKDFYLGKTYSYFVEHEEDLSLSSDALVYWSYQTSVMNPMTYYTLFQDSSLPLAKITFKSLDWRRRDAKSDDPSNEVVMCHKQGENFIRVKSDNAVKISASQDCFNLSSSRVTPSENFDTVELLKAGFAAVSSIWS